MKISRVSHIKTISVERCCSLNIESITLHIVSFHCLNVQLDSVIYPALIGHSFPLIWEIFAENPFQTCIKLVTHVFMYFALSSEDGILLNELFIPEGRLGHPPMRIARVTAFSSNYCKVKYEGQLLVLSECF